ncbi:MAG TPA: hypothetical protein PLQ93_05740 [Bacteroidia bacterium]|nr:hypothetical protein [Bacteroidia bacterium]
MEILKHRAILAFMLTLNFIQAQDRFYFRNGTYKEARLVSVAKNWVYYRSSDTTQVESILKTELLLIDTEKGGRYLFSSKPDSSSGSHPKEFTKIKNRNVIGLQPFGVFFGRVTVVYERLLGKDLGLVIPFSLTFDPFGTIYKIPNDSGAATPHIPGVYYILGCDLNYYLNQDEKSRFFIGPRYRYGVDQFLGGLEGSSLQFQLGWRYLSSKGIQQHLSIGYGFVKVLSVPATSGVSPDQLYAWFSLNYRISLSW